VIRAIINAITMLVIISYCWQQMSPEAARCTSHGGKYYLFNGCVMAPKLVIPVPLGGQ
jgi:hypothetical protein